MFTKEEASRIRKQFWTSLGQYLKPLPNADGEIINWINYRTGVKNIFIRLEANAKNAQIYLELNHADDGLRALIYEQFLELKPLFEQAAGKDWEWQAQTQNTDYKMVARITASLKACNIYQQQSWPQLIQFFKERLLALDAFWCDVKPIFEELT